MLGTAKFINNGMSPTLPKTLTSHHCQTPVDSYERIWRTHAEADDPLCQLLEILQLKSFWKRTWGCNGPKKRRDVYNQCMQTWSLNPSDLRVLLSQLYSWAQVTDASRRSSTSLCPSNCRHGKWWSNIPVNLVRFDFMVANTSKTQKPTLQGFLARKRESMWVHDQIHP